MPWRTAAGSAGVSGSGSGSASATGSGISHSIVPNVGSGSGSGFEDRLGLLEHGLRLGLGGDRGGLLAAEEAGPEAALGLLDRGDGLTGSWLGQRLRVVGFDRLLRLRPAQAPARGPRRAPAYRP